MVVRLAVLRIGRHLNVIIHVYFSSSCMFECVIRTQSVRMLYAAAENACIALYSYLQHSDAVNRAQHLSRRFSLANN